MQEAEAGYVKNRLKIEGKGKGKRKSCHDRGHVETVQAE